MHFAPKRPPAKPSITNPSALVLLVTEETPLIPTLVVTELNAKLTMIVPLPSLVTRKTKNVLILAMVSLAVKKALAERKTINPFATANLVTNLSMANVLILMNALSPDLAIPQPFVATPLDPSLARVPREVLEMPEIQVANPDPNAKLTVIAPRPQLVGLVGVLILALVNVVKVLFVKWLPIKPFALVLPELPETLGLNADNLNVWKIRNVPWVDLASKTSVWMLAHWLEFVVPMLFVQF